MAFVIWCSGFDPFPFLGQENLPMSIFTVNMIDWFFAFSGERGKATGEPIPVSARAVRRPNHHSGRRAVFPSTRRHCLPGDPISRYLSIDAPE